MIRGVKRFVNKKFIYTTDLCLLRRFLTPYKGQINLDFSCLDEDTKKTRALLYEYFLNADENYPPEMLADLHRVSELSTEAGINHLHHIAESSEIEIIPPSELEDNHGLRINPRYLALRAFLDYPELFNNASDRLAFDDEKSPAEFVGLQENIKPCLDSKSCFAFEAEASKFFNARYHGRYCKVRWYPDEDGINIIVIHGKQPVTTLVIMKDKEKPLTFREMKQDNLAYDQNTGRLKVTARSEVEKQQLCAIFADSILGKPKFFEHNNSRNLYTLRPISEAGVEFQLNGEWDPAFLDATVTEIQICNNLRGGWVVTIRDSRNALSRLYEKSPNLDLGQANINYIKLRFTFLVNGKKRKKTVKIKPPSSASFDRTSLEAKVMEHLKRNGFCVSRDAFTTID